MFTPHTKVRSIIAAFLNELVNIPFKITNARSRYFKMDMNSFAQDNLVTSANTAFRNNPIFIKAYARSIKAAGWDYSIQWRTHVFLWAANNALSLAKKGGCYVELGTGRGWMFSAFLEQTSWKDAGCNLWLFDSFRSEMIDRDSGYQLNNSARNTCYAENFESTRINFSEWPRVNLVQGWLPETLVNLSDSKIAFLHVDLNHHIAEAECIKILWGRVMRNGIMLLDDYGASGAEKQYDAINLIAAELKFSILTLPTGQGLVIKEDRE